jgi:hypothetical protein
MVEPNHLNPMSLHIPLSPEAARALRAQRRASTIASILISLLSIVLVCVLLALVLLPALVKESPEIVVIHTPTVSDDDSPEPKRMSAQRAKPSAPSAASAARVMVANAPAPTAVEVPELAFESEFFGSGMDDFGAGGMGADDGSGAGGGAGGGFGSSGARAGSLEGSLYDFKQKPDGRPISYDLGNRAEFVDRVVRLQRSNFSESALKRHFRAPNQLFLTHLAVADSPASAGPEFFGAKDSIQPSGWLAHYRGQIRVPKSGSYRFVGLGDDYMGVFLDGRMRLAASWSDIQEGVAGRWEPTAPTGEHLSPFTGMRLVYGDWVKLREGELIDFDLAIGERPGGRVGFMLMVEEQGVDYRKAADGRPILPLFTTAPLSSEEKDRVVREFGSWEFEWDRVPVFGVK